jgi:predicted DNA-binding protein (MmcQ/YjbR family)
MTREEFEAAVLDFYGVRADYPFEEDFETGVFRHSDSGKWFAIAMNIPKDKLVKGAEGSVDVVNLKCSPEIIDSIAGCDSGIFRAYHMNKMHWLTVLLDGSCDDSELFWLLGISFKLTESAARKRVDKKR